MRNRPHRSVVSSVVIGVVAAWSVVAMAGFSPANAKATKSEQVLVRSLLTEMLSRPPSATTQSCVVNRLRAGTLSATLADGASNVSLAESIPFRGVMRVIFGCQPKELVSGLASSLRGSAMTLTQRSCVAGGFLGRMTVDDELLTLAIRDGVDGTFSGLSSPEIVVRNMRPAVQKCVPAALVDEIITTLFE